METPRQDRALFLGSLSGSYGSPPLVGKSRSFAEPTQQQPTPVAGDTEMQDVVTQMRGMQLEEDKVTADFRLPFQTSDGSDQQELSAHVPRLPFQSFAFNRRAAGGGGCARLNDASWFLPSPSMPLYGLGTTENLKPSSTSSSHQDSRDRSNSFLVNDAPRLPSSPDLDASVDRDLTRPTGFLPPPIFSPLYKYSSVNNTNALVHEQVSANDMAITAYLYTHGPNGTMMPSASMYCPPTPVYHNNYNSSSSRSAPPSMPIIGTPTPPVDRKLLKMRKGYCDLALNTPQFSSSYHNSMMMMTPS